MAVLVFISKVLFYDPLDFRENNRIQTAGQDYITEHMIDL